MSDTLCGVCEVGAVIIPMDKETNSDMAVRRWATVLLAKKLIRLCVSVLSLCDIVPRTDSCAYRHKIVVCLDVMDGCFTPVSLLYTHLWGRNSQPSQTCAYYTCTNVKANFEQMCSTAFLL